MKENFEYSIHKIWDTPSISKSKTRNIESNDYQIAGFIYNFGLLLPDESSNNNFYFFLRLKNPPNEPHTINIIIKLLGKKKLEIPKSKYTFNQKDSVFIIPYPLSKDESINYLRKDKFSIDITIQSIQEIENKPNYRDITGFIGLKNQASTCYMNSILQLLFHIPSFRRLIYSLPENDSSIILNLQRLFCLMQLSPTSVSTKELTESFGWTSIDSFIQHDVQEFVRVLISKLEEKTSLNGQIKSFFTGTISNYIRCINYDYQSNREEIFYDISLVIKNKKNLYESLNSFIADDLLIDKNQYQLENGQKEDAVMGCRFLKLPPILHFHLNRFEYSSKSNTGMIKLNDYFEFPKELNMNPYMLESSNNEIFELFAVLIHIGKESFSGHNIAYCRPTIENRWYRFNDEIVELVTEKDVIENNFGNPNQSNSAYFLSYIRKSDIKWIMEQINNKELPNHLIDYYEIQKSSLDPNSISIQVVNLPIKPISINKLNNFGSFLQEIQKNNSLNKIKEIWSVDKDNFPISKINKKIQINEIFNKFGKVFLTELDSSKLNYPICLEIKFFFRSKQQYIYNFGFHLFSLNSNIENILPLIYNLTNLNSNISLLCFYEKNLEVKQINNFKNSLNSLLILSGTLIFQNQDIIEIPNNFIIEENKNLLKVRELIPEIKLDTVPRFINHIKRCIHILVNLNNEELFKIEIPDIMHLKILIKLIRNHLKLEENEGIAIYNKLNGDLINKNHSKDLKTALDIKETFKQFMIIPIYIKIIKNYNQNEIDSFISLHFSLLDQFFNYIQEINLEIPFNFTVTQILNETKIQSNLNLNLPLRLINLNGSKILNILSNNLIAQNLINLQLRVEIIPEDQLIINYEEEFLIKVCFSHNYNYPFNGCVLVPFYLKIIKDEPFILTMCRILSLLNDNIGNCNYILYKGQVQGQRFKIIQEDDIIFNLTNSNDSTLFIMLSSEQLMKLYGIYQKNSIQIK